MDRDNLVRTFIAVVASLVIMVGWQFFFAPKPAETQPGSPEAAQVEPAPGSETLPAQQQSPQPPPEQPVSAAPLVVPNAEPYSAEAVVGQEGQENLTISSEHREVVFSPRGARLVAYRLLDHDQAPGVERPRPLDLVSPVARALHHEPLYITTGDAARDEAINNAWYVVSEDPPSAEERAALDLPEETRRIAFDWADGFGLEVHKTAYFCPEEEYIFRLSWDVSQNGVSLEDAMISWGPGISRVGEDSSGNRYAYWGRVVAALPSELLHYDPKDKDYAAGVVWPHGFGPRWLALDTQYFSLAIIVDSQEDSLIRAFDTSALGEDALTQSFAIETATRNMKIFGGPKIDTLLKQVDGKLGSDLGQLVDWGFFGVVARPLFLALLWVQSFTGNWGFAIILITIVIKLIFFPITQKSMITMRKTQQKMSTLQPKIRHIKEKYRDKKDMDSRKLMNEEMMALYSREGVNPMGGLSGCMPMLLQLPILWAMYKVLSIATSLRGAPFFGWIHDLSVADPYYITPLVMGVTMLAQQLISMTKTEDPQQKSQQRMMLMMPVMFTYFFISLPAGLVLYWLTNNVLGIGQQILINRSAAKAGVTPAAPTKKK